MGAWIEHAQDVLAVQASLQQYDEALADADKVRLSPCLCVQGYQK